VQLLVQTRAEFIRRQAAGSLGQIILTEEQQKMVVSGSESENNFDLFQSCYQLLWDIAQSLSYAEFYQAWHGSL